ncbi:AraC family transcriptional regulator [Actinoplanes sp. NPDC023936]|uniref:helix-turn-helix domain-containing protein n=1 Tax=Actinoplanes sp. NPDC023936 TaxID=3154910 RepID=UPI0033D45E06
MLTVVRCAGAGRWSAEEAVTRPALVLVRRGRFVRRVNGRARLADVTTGYVQHPGEVQQVAHPAGGDVCTAIGLPEEIADQFPTHLVRVTSAADLLHRRLLRAVERNELVAELVGSLLPVPALPHPVVEDVRELVHADPALDLTALAAAVGWSPWHLSRAFRLATGDTLRAYRRRLRVRAALDELDGGGGLASVAARTGFADQAHMTRAISAETGMPPGALRRTLLRRTP